MEGLFVLLALIPIALVVLMVRLLVRMGALMRDLRQMQEQFTALLSRPEAHRSAAEAPFSTRTEEDLTSEQFVSVPPPIITPPPTPPKVEEEPAIEHMWELVPEPILFADTIEQIRPDPIHEDPYHTIPPEPPRTPKPSFFEGHPDLEKFIGENLINKIGITVLVIGIGLLLKYAIGQGMISETGRTLIGLVAGGVLLFFAHRSRSGFRAFSSVLVAGGIAVFYFTIAIAFHQYDLIGQLPAFGIMVVITGLAVLLTLSYDRKELAVIALLGGLATPFMVSTGEGNFRVLFTYLLILDVGMLVLANYKKWHIINMISFAGTVLIFGSWATMRYPDLDPQPALQAFAFATAFFLVFFGMNLRYNLRHKEAFVALDHILLLLNTALYYGVGIYLLSDLTVRVTGLFTVLLGLFYMVFAWYFHRREGIPSALKFLLIGLVLTFISLAAPVQLEGNHITLFWAAEAVLLLWFAQRAGIRLVERGAVLVMVLMLFSLWMDLEHIYGWGGAENMRPLLNKGWITGMVAAIALGAVTFLLRKREPEHLVVRGIRASVLAQVTAAIGVLVLYVANYLEQRYQLGRTLDSNVVDMALMAYTLLFVLVLEVATRSAILLVRSAVGLLLIVCGFAYITQFYSSSRWALEMAQHGTGGGGFLSFHYVAMVLMVIATVRITHVARERIARPSKPWNIYLWCMCAFIVVFASQELDHAMLLGRTGTAAMLDNARRVGYPILWGICSFTMMWYGMRAHMRMMRVIALTLFAITLLKLFLFDLGELSEGGRVAAFIFLGALLLVISFMYQKLKLLLVEDAPAGLGHEDAAPIEGEGSQNEGS